MPIWKKNIFVNVIKTIMVNEGKTADIIISEYTKLTETEKTEILAVIATQ